MTKPALLHLLQADRDLPIGHFESSRFSDLVPKLQCENEAMCKVVLISIKNKVPWGWNFSKFKVGEWIIIWDRGIQWSDGGKGKNKLNCLIYASKLQQWGDKNCLFCQRPKKPEESESKFLVPKILFFIPMRATSDHWNARTRKWPIYALHFVPPIRR